MNAQRHATPDTAAGDETMAEIITDKRGYAARWHYSVRHVDHLLALGMPHYKVGARRVRILITEADAWMRERFGARRLGPARRAS